MASAIVARSGRTPERHRQVPLEFRGNGTGTDPWLARAVLDAGYPADALAVVTGDREAVLARPCSPRCSATTRSRS
jgi:hypothetical protein